MADQLVCAQGAQGSPFPDRSWRQRRKLQPRGERFPKAVRNQAYSPVDNVSELTARANDEGWDTIFSGWLDVSNLGADDAILIFSVGGGDVERNVSTNIVKAIDFAKSRRAKVFGMVGKDNGYTALNGDVVVSCRKSIPLASRHYRRHFRP